MEQNFGRQRISLVQPAQNSPLVQVCKSLSEAFIFALTNPQYDKRLFIELQV